MWYPSLVTGTVSLLFSSFIDKSVSMSALKEDITARIFILNSRVSGTGD
jgi:hypothetical protein